MNRVRSPTVRERKAASGLIERVESRTLPSLTVGLLTPIVSTPLRLADQILPRGASCLNQIPKHQPREAIFNRDARRIAIAGVNVVE